MVKGACSTWIGGSASACRHCPTCKKGDGEWWSGERPTSRTCKVTVTLDKLIKHYYFFFLFFFSLFGLVLVLGLT